MTLVIIGASVILLAMLVCVALVALDAKRDVASAPRAAMFVCAKHGAFPSKYVLKAPAPVEAGEIDVCPMCFEDAQKQALVTARKQA